MLSISRFLAVLAAVALALVAWLLWPNERNSDGTSAAPTDASTGSGVAGQLSSAADPSSSEPDARLEPQAVELGSPATVPADAGPRVLRGRVVLVEANGAQRDDAAGTFHLNLHLGDEIERHEVSFERGLWLAAVPLPTEAPRVSASSAQVDGRRVIVVDLEEPSDLPESNELVVRLRAPPPSLLRVLDASTGAELGNVSIVKPAERGSSDPVHPGIGFESLRVGSGLDSPIDLGTFSLALFSWDRARFHVGAPGYAWALAEIPWRSGGETSVALARGATLVIDVSGVEPAAGTRLRVWAADRPVPWLDEPLDSNRSIELSGLPAGPTLVTAEIGSWHARSLRLAHASVELRADERGQVSLALDEAPVLVTARAGGTIHVASAWGLTELAVNLELQGVPLGGRSAGVVAHVTREASTREGFESFRWIAEDVQVGRHKLSVEQPFAVRQLEIPAGGKQDFEFTLGAPAELLVRVVDALTGAAVSVESLTWNPRPPGPYHGGSRYYAPFDAERGAYVIRALREPVSISIWSGDYLPYDEVIDLSTGDREHVARLELGTVLVVKLRCEGTGLVIPSSWQAEPVDPTEKGYVRLTSFDPLARIFVVSEPGTYELDPPVLEGFLGLPRQTVQLPAGQRTELVLEYERVR